MTSVNTATQVDEGKLNAFIGQMLNDLGGASSIAMVRMGDALGLYKELHTKGPMTSTELAKAAKVHERYLRECLSHRARALGGSTWSVPTCRRPPCSVASAPSRNTSSRPPASVKRCRRSRRP